MIERGGFKRALAVAGAVLVLGASGVATATSALAAEVDDDTGVYFCPEGWYGVIVGVQTPSGERYITACVQA